MDKDRKEMHNLKRQQEASQVRESRIVTAYVKFKHPEIYAKAKDVYTKLDTLYPQKKDLRRTYEFQTFITGTKDNKYKRYKRKSQDESLDNMCLELSDNMLLKIPLMDKSAVPAVAPAVVPVVVPTVDAVVAPAVAPAVVPVVVPTVAPAVDAVVAPTVVPPVAPAVDALPMFPDDMNALPMLPDDMIDEIVRSLSQDPDITTFFDDIFDETPLESELTALGF